MVAGGIVPRMRTVGIGLVGAGFLAETRARCYAKVSGVEARLVAVAARSEDSARGFAERHAVPRWFTAVDELLALPEVDVVDLCVPNLLHRPLAERSAAAGKHVICTKPLSAYVGQDLPADADDAAVAARDRRTMLAVAVDDAQAMVDAAAQNGVQLMYGENWVYAPAIQRARALLQKSGGTLLEMRGWEGHNGSHSPYSKIWRYTGGGALLRLAAHPIGAMLDLKRAEGEARGGAPIRPVAVTAEVSDLSRIASLEDHEVFVAGGWQDVENWGCAILSFEDGSRGVAYGGDVLLGGMESKLELFASNCQLKCNLSPTDMLRAYAPSEAVFGDAYLMEKSSTAAGWSTPMPDEDWTSGQLAMCEEFARAVAEGRGTRSDGALGRDVTRVVYAAYVAAAEGRRVEL